MRQKINILLHGFININVMDGSAVFITGLAKMLSLNPDIRVDFVLANPVRRDILLQELYDIENLNIISPFDDEQLTAPNPNWYKRKRFTHEEAAHVLSYYWGKKEYDWFMIRGMEVVKELYAINPTIFEKLMTYVTGITSEDQEFTQQEIENIENIFNSSAYLLCQTNEMKSFLNKKFASSLKSTEIITLNPMIPNTTDKFSNVFEEKECYNKLCYVGKFHYDWNSIPMIVGFREVRVNNPNSTLSVAGDKFSVHKAYPHYNEDLKYLLGKTDNLFWYGALSREDARSLIASSDIGITWRDESMNSSLELSTKLLEYGSFGKAVIMNRTPMHTEIFGEDYPLYANSLDEFESVIKLVINNPDIYYRAAKRMFEASQKFTYSETLKKLTPFLFDSKLDSFLNQNGYIVNGDFSNNNNPTIINHKNSKSSSDVLYKFEVSDINSAIEFITESSKFGLITNYYIQNNIIYTIIKNNEKTKEENILNNINNNIFKDLLSHLIAKINYLNEGEKFIENLKLKSKFQFELSEKESSEALNSSNHSYNSESSLKRRIKELEQLEKRYYALANSKLGKLTYKYWGFKKRTRN